LRRPDQEVALRAIIEKSSLSWHEPDLRVIWLVRLAKA
jgi:hypothetical protein